MFLNFVCNLFHLLNFGLWFRLPPYNCDLNPIEGVWNDVKHAVRKQNTQQNVQTITDIAKKVMLEYPIEKWQAHVRHAERFLDKNLCIKFQGLSFIHVYFNILCRLGEQYWENDGFFEDYMEQEGSMIVSGNL